MKPFDNSDDLNADTVPEIIQKLWALYKDMSTDPALASSACHIRSAALALEDTRRMAMQVYLEGQQHSPCKPAKKTTRRAARGTRTIKDDAAVDWLLAAPAASPWKN